MVARVAANRLGKTQLATIRIQQLPGAAAFFGGILHFVPLAATVGLQSDAPGFFFLHIEAHAAPTAIQPRQAAAGRHAIGTSGAVQDGDQ